MNKHLVEFIVPNLKSDAQSQATFRAQWPKWCKTVIEAPGSSQVHYGYMASENDVDVSSLMKLVISLKWNERDQFTTFLKSDEFQGFVGKIKPYTQGPPSLQLYESTAEGAGVFANGVTEVFRVSVSSPQNAAEIENAWASFRDAVQKGRIVKELHGLSVNTPQQTFVGALGWPELKDREEVLKDTTVADARKKFLTFEDSNSFVVKLEPAAEAS